MRGSRARLGRLRRRRRGARLGKTELSGAVTVDRQGRTRALVQTMRDPGSRVMVMTQALTVSDFGAPVTVTPPPADQTSP
jgi:hypothetical protein